MAVLSQGTSFTFNFTPYTVTRVTVQRGGSANSNRQRVSTAHLGSDPDKEEPYLEIWQPNANDGGGNTVDIDFLGGSMPTINATGTLTISGGLSFSWTAATCASSSVTAAVGDIIKGSASFKIPS